MGLLAVLLILLLGYHYVDAVPYEKIKLKRSSGWVSYTHLAKYGVKFLLQALVSIFFAAIGGFLIAAIKAHYTRHLGYKEIFETFYKYLYSLVFQPVPQLIIFASIVLFAWIISEYNIQKSLTKDWLNEIKKEDSILDIVIEAIKTRSMVKVSLKSRKIYIGLIQSEQFERLDLDNIVIIPFLSGYREKDNLRIHFDCNYASMYLNKKLIPHSSEFDIKCAKKLEQFRLSIRLDEIESISLFDDRYYNDFEQLEP